MSIPGDAQHIHRIAMNQVDITSESDLYLIAEYRYTSYSTVMKYQLIIYVLHSNLSVYTRSTDVYKKHIVSQSSQIKSTSTTQITLHNMWYRQLDYPLQLKLYNLLLLCTSSLRYDIILG